MDVLVWGWYEPDILGVSCDVNSGKPWVGVHAPFQLSLLGGVCDAGRDWVGRSKPKPEVGAHRISIGPSACEPLSVLHARLVLPTQAPR